MNNVKVFWFTVVLGIVVMLGAYKYLEYKTISGVAEKFSDSIVKDFRYESDMEKSGNKNFPVVVAALGFQTEEQIKNFKKLKKTDNEIVDDGIFALNVLKEKNKQYLSLISEHKELFVKEQKLSKLLFGQRGKFVKDFLSNQIHYYDNIEQDSKNNLVDGDLILNMLTIGKDRNNLSSFTKITANNYKNYSKNFQLISSLEKYSRNDFHFVNEDEIKRRNSYGYEMLIRNKEYFSIYYQIVKDIVEGDYDSATYKETKLNSVTANFNFDMEKVFDANSESSLENSKLIADFALKQVELITGFKQNKLGKYPIVKEIDDWKESLFLCDTFPYRAGIYKTITNKYVKSTKLPDLLDEFNDAGIQVIKEDREFDSNLLTITNDDKKLIFTCIDKDSGEKFEKEVVKI